MEDDEREEAEEVKVKVKDEDDDDDNEPEISLDISKDQIFLILLSLVTGIAIGFLVAKLLETRDEQKETNRKLDLMAYMQNRRNQDYFFPGKPYDPNELLQQPRPHVIEKSYESDIASMRPRVLRDPDSGGIMGVEDDSLYQHENWVVKRDGRGKVIDYYVK